MSFYRNDLSKLKTMLTDIVNNDNANKDDFNNGYFMVNINLSFPSDERASSNNDELYTCFRNLFIDKLSTDPYYNYFYTHDIDIQNKYKYFIYLSNVLYYYTKLIYIFSGLDLYYTKKRGILRIDDLLICMLNCNETIDDVYINNYEYKSKECIYHKINTIRSEWCKLIKAQQLLSFAKFKFILDDIIISDDIINKTIDYIIHKNSNDIIVKSVGLTLSIGYENKLIIIPDCELDIYSDEEMTPF